MYLLVFTGALFCWFLLVWNRRERKTHNNNKKMIVIITIVKYKKLFDFYSILFLLFTQE